MGSFNEETGAKPLAAGWIVLYEEPAERLSDTVQRKRKVSSLPYHEVTAIFGGSNKVFQLPAESTENATRAEQASDTVQDEEGQDSHLYEDWWDDEESFAFSILKKFDRKALQWCLGHIGSNDRLAFLESRFVQENFSNAPRGRIWLITEACLKLLEECTENELENMWTPALYLAQTERKRRQSRWESLEKKKDRSWHKNVQEMMYLLERESFPSDEQLCCWHFIVDWTELFCLPKVLSCLITDLNSIADRKSLVRKSRWGIIDQKRCFRCLRDILCKNDDGAAVKQHQIPGVPQLNDHAKQVLDVAVQIEEAKLKQTAKREQHKPGQRLSRKRMCQSVHSTQSGSPAICWLAQWHIENDTEISLDQGMAL